jgi:glyoxylase-like metal-dependent hydrolase (beta-lactamase superfamily II)
MAELQTYGNNCNSYVIANALRGGRHVIIDPGQVTNEVGRHCLDSLLGEMKKDGIEVEDIGLIILTHAHPDHYGASEEIKERSKASITINKEEDEYRRTIGERIGKMFGIEIPEFEPNFYLEEGELNLGDTLNLEILLTPGHSPGHISIYWPAEKILLAGDVIFYGSTGRVDLPRGNAGMLKESIEMLSQLEIEYLLTGHQYGGPGIIEGEENIKRNFDVVRREVFPYL